jgi:hypothetical protein
MKFIRIKKIDIFFYGVFLMIFAGCHFFGSNHSEEPVARVHGQYLYLSELRNAIPENITEDDSVIYANAYIDRWIRKKIMLEKAEMNLPPKKKDVQKQLDEYRASLLIHRYQDQLLKEKMDTTVVDSKIQDYYVQYKENFHLEEHIVQSIFIKVSKDAPDLNRLFKLYKANEEKDLKELEDYVYHHAIQYEYIRDEWVPFNDLLERMPFSVDNQENLLRNRKFIETQDSVFYYLVNILDYKLAGDVAPVEFVKEDIVDILVNKKRIQYFNDLEKEMYQNARTNGDFEIF